MSLPLFSTYEMLKCQEYFCVREYQTSTRRNVLVQLTYFFIFKTIVSNDEVYNIYVVKYRTSRVLPTLLIFYNLKTNCNVIKEKNTLFV